MDFNKLWQQLDSEKQHIAAIAAFIPPPISLDLWATTTSISPVKVLQLAEEFVRLKVMSNYEPMGAGYYFYKDREIIQAILLTIDPEKINKIANHLIRVFKSEFEDGPPLWLALAHLYQLSKVEPADTKVLIKAADYCLKLNLPEDAVLYFQLVLDLTTISSITADGKRVYVDAVLGLCLYKGKTIPLEEQEGLLETAESFSVYLQDPSRTALVFSHSGQISKRLGKYDKAAKMFEEAWRMASLAGSHEVVKRVALASTDFLIWQGRIAEAIERYENVLGNLEELPLDEQSLLACAQLGWFYGKCGQTTRGIGLIASVMEKATEFKFDRLIVYAKVLSINTFHDARKNAEAEPIIDELLEIPHDKLDLWVLWPLYAAKAYAHCCRGEYEESFKMQQQAYTNAKLLGNYHHRGPINFDYIDILEDHGFVHPEMNYDAEVQRVINWPDIYMQGVGYYYRAKRTIKLNGPIEGAIKDLRASQELLTQSGATLDLAYTQVLLGQLLLQSDKTEQAEELLKKAWKVLRLVNETLFPIELRAIVQEQSQDISLLEPLIEINETLGTIRSRRELLNHVITLTMQLTGAERGAFFVSTLDAAVEIIASRNIEPDLFQTKTFSQAFMAIKQVIGGGEKIVIKNDSSKVANVGLLATTGWQIIYPVTLQGKTLGCFFIERNLSGFAVSERIFPLLKAISTQVAVALDNVRAYEEIAELKDQLEAETLFYRRGPSNILQVKDIVGESEKIKEVISKICDVAQSDTTVLIVGETGVGKELVAKALHQLSNRASGPFIPVNIASLNENLVTSELFGHEKGAFTHALKSHRGRFELASRGTLFLDEINSLSLDIQSKLLRVLEEKVFERVGGTTEIKSNFRLIAATNQLLENSIKEGGFRADLYYRLKVFTITVPPVRERKQDIPLLVSYFVKEYNQKFGKNFKKVNKRSMQNLLDYHWPGNVRELKHSVERAVLTCKDKQLSFDELIFSEPVETGNQPFLPLKDMERRYILEALSRCDWVVSGPRGAAKLLGLNPQTLYSKIKRLGIEKTSYVEFS